MAPEGGRLDDITPIVRGGFLFPNVPEDEVSFTFHDDDQGLFEIGGEVLIEKAADEVCELPSDIRTSSG